LNTMIKAQKKRMFLDAKGIIMIKAAMYTI